MSDDSDPPKNPFIRWKQHVDTHIGTTLHGLLGIPTMVSKNLNIRQELGKGDETGPAEGGQQTSSASSATSSPQQPPLPQANNDSYHSALPPTTPPNSHLPSDDNALDGVDAAQLLEWHKFVYYSPYSPLKLQQQQQLHLLPPPVPQDVPFGADPFAFTYADAFEDLLRTSSGRPLLDLGDRSYRNLRYQMRYGSAIEPPYVFFHRMHSQRLLDAYFPRVAAARSEAEADRTTDTSNDDIVRAVAALAERDRDMWREQLDEENADKHYEHDSEGDTGRWEEPSENKTTSQESWNQEKANATPRSPGYGGSLFNELDRVFRVLGRIIDEDTSGAPADGSKTDDSTSVSENEPSAEDELYNSVRSAYANAEKSLSTLIKSFSGGFDSEDRFKRTSATTETEVRADERTSDDGGQGETIQTTEEHVDAFGNRHVKTVVQRLDADGNEMSRETRYTIRSQTPQEAALKETYGDGDDSDDTDEQPRTAEENGAPQPSNTNHGTKNSGWFWK